jgi:hypothetical protein
MRTTIAAMLFSLCTLSVNAVAQDSDLNLEPCINGGVSASGKFSSQEAEDQFMKEQQVEAKQHDLEPCISGGVSASGRYPSQEAQDQQQQSDIEEIERFSAFE